MLDPTDPAGTRAREVDSLLASFERCAGPEDRARVAEALRRTSVEDERIRAAFVRMLEDDPIEGSRCLAAFGDPRSPAPDPDAPRVQVVREGPGLTAVFSGNTFASPTASIAARRARVAMSG